MPATIMTLVAVRRSRTMATVRLCHPSMRWSWAARHSSRCLRLTELPPGAPETVLLRAAAPEKLIEDLKVLGFHHLYIDGGKTIQEFLRAGLVDRLIITRIPVLLGEGIPLFGPLPGDIHLRHDETRAYENGFVQSAYSVVR